ncbi:MAG: NifU family protein [Alphaproteobacteria bacterium]|jgi:Fe-S cluster biogenesis protein NfuA|nr:NifU family protein [Alphaproteobacteria bacterium]MDP6565174.1 NifU family protein [Alphaproteobacteria bacterium]MDP6812305.1 NifU family protein [Alphaproteobacteria bacterium]
MFIQTETTPNPETLKFLPGVGVLPSGSVDYRGPEEAEASPLAQSLFGIEGVAGVFLGTDFISVTKQGGEWYHLKPLILGVVMEHFTRGLPVLMEQPSESVDRGAGMYDEADGEVVEQITELLETRVRPVVAQDGGDIVFHGFQEGVVYLHMQGACAGCPSSTMTLKHGIERMLCHYIPEVTEVRAI